MPRRPRGDACRSYFPLLAGERLTDADTAVVWRQALLAMADALT